MLNGKEEEKVDLALITAKQVLILFFLIFAGYLVARTGVIQLEAKKAFSDLLLYLVVPLMVIHSYMTEFDPSVFSNLMLSFGLSAVLLLLGLAITMLLTAKMQGRHRAILRFACIFSNAAYMGFPLIEALFGQEGLLYASAFVTVFNILLWTIGYRMVSDQAQDRNIIKTICTTPVLIAVVLGLAIYLGRVPVPELVKQPLALIANMNTPLSMIITGMMIAGSDMKKLLKNPNLGILIVIRMLVIPVVCFGIFALLGIHGMAAEVVVLLEACPSAAITSVFAVQYHHDEELAAGAVVFTTLLSIVTLPLCAFLLTMMM